MATVKAFEETHPDAFDLVEWCCFTKEHRQPMIVPSTRWNKWQKIVIVFWPAPPTIDIRIIYTERRSYDIRRKSRDGCGIKK